MNPIYLRARCSEELLNAVKKIAKEEGIVPGVLIRRVVSRYVAGRIAERIDADDDDGDES